MWRWDPNVLRYRDEQGRFLAHDRVLELLSQSIASTVDLTGMLASYVSSGALSVTDWQSVFRESIKREYIRQYLAGVGGRAQMTQADWGSIGRMLRDQYAWLKDFAKEVAAGKMSESQIRARMAMYINSAREAHEKSNGKVAVKWGADEVSWILSPLIENCNTCEERSRMGWQPIAAGGGFPTIDGEAFPGDGQSECLCVVSGDSPVLTKRGWIPLLDVMAGDMVLTHKNRWRFVRALVVKPSAPYHKLAYVRGVACTDNHLWWTADGWQDARQLYGNPAAVIQQVQGQAAMPAEHNWYFYHDQQLAVEMRIVNAGKTLRQLQEYHGFHRERMYWQLERHNSTVALADAVLPRGTLVYDLTVDQDHSFCIGGIFAHNTNCQCHLGYQNSLTGEEFQS